MDLQQEGNRCSVNWSRFKSVFDLSWPHCGNTNSDSLPVNHAADARKEHLLTLPRSLSITRRMGLCELVTSFSLTHSRLSSGPAHPVCGCGRVCERERACVWFAVICRRLYWVDLGRFCSGTCVVFCLDSFFFLFLPFVVWGLFQSLVQERIFSSINVFMVFFTL